MTIIFSYFLKGILSFGDLFFHRKTGRSAPRGLLIAGERVSVPQFRELGMKVVQGIAALGRLLPYLGGPSSAYRKLYSVVCWIIVTCVPTHGPVLAEEKTKGPSGDGDPFALYSDCTRLRFALRVRVWGARTMFFFTYPLTRKKLQQIHWEGQDALIAKAGGGSGLVLLRSMHYSAMRPVLERWVRERKTSDPR